ncbi:MAG: recombinase family protein [Clostridia bacterium]|nr:recombinase family protein [Clostridia bacterium]
MVAIYARQSIDKKDSISIETQLEYGKNICKLENLNYKEYFDKGFSGSNLDRPEFKKLLIDIENGIIDKVICYRLDRVSRSLVDFSNLLTLFKKYNVEFVSATENFDTSTPIGRAMINIIMVFAQLERETIQKRITDNYYARIKAGSFSGGTPPLGYNNTKKLINGKKTAVLAPNDNINIVKNIFEDYLNGNSLREISIKYKDITHTQIKNILSNPIYTENTVDLYSYYKSKGYIIHNPIEEFNGKNSLQICGKEKGKGKNRIKTKKEEQIVSISICTPIIPANKFLIIQKKLESNKKYDYGRKKSKYTWLTGLLKCGKCNHSVGLKGTNNYKYFMCRYAKDFKGCGNTQTYNLKELENIIHLYLISFIQTIDLEKLNKKKVQNDLITELNNQKIIKNKIKEQIDNIADAIASGISISPMLESKAHALSVELQNANKKISNIQIEISKSQNSQININKFSKAINNLRTSFDSLLVEEKYKIAKLFIKKIYIHDKTIIINYIF